ARRRRPYRQTVLDLRREVSGLYLLPVRGVRIVEDFLHSVDDRQPRSRWIALVMDEDRIRAQHTRPAERCEVTLKSVAGDLFPDPHCLLFSGLVAFDTRDVED